MQIKVIFFKLRISIVSFMLNVDTNCINFYVYNFKPNFLQLCVSLLGALILTICMFTVLQPTRYPHLHVLLNCVYSGIHFIGFAIYFNILQYTEVPLNLSASKPKIY